MRYSMSVLLFTTALAFGIAAPTSGQVINEDFKLLPSDGAMGDIFGYSIAIDNGVIAVGSFGDQDKGDFTGSAYLFDASTGAEIAKLLPNDGALGEYFGISIAIGNGIVAVGAIGGHDKGYFSGSAYLFDASTGAQIAKLLPSDGAEYDEFGHSIAIGNGVVAVGAHADDDNGLESGSAYLFDASTGAQIAKLLPSDGATGDYFGSSIAIDNGIVAIGASGDEDNGIWTGSVYLFDASTGAQIAKLLPSNGAGGDHFGYSIAIDNGVIAVGAVGDDDNGGQSGAAYLFNASTGAQIAKLLPSDGASEDWFGRSIAINNGVVAVGAWLDDDNGSDSGSAYLFDASTGTQFAKLLSSDGAADDWFGTTIAIGNGIVAVGAWLDDHNGIDSGSAYLFDVGSRRSCLDLIIENLVAGEQATFTITNGNVGAKTVTVYGTQPGDVFMRNYAGYCATFGIEGVTQNKVIGGYNRTFDANGKITFQLSIPGNLSGQRLFFQSAEHGTCPYECVSNLVEMVVQ